MKRAESDPIDRLSPEERAELTKKLEGLGAEIEKAFVGIPFRYPRIIERGLTERLDKALDALLPDDGSDEEFTDDELDDAEALLRAVTENVRLTRIFKRVLQASLGDCEELFREVKRIQEKAN